MSSFWGHVKCTVPVGSPGRNSKCKVDAQGKVLDKKNVCNISKQTIINGNRSHPVREPVQGRQKKATFLDQGQRKGTLH